MERSVIKIDKLSKYYKDFQAIKNLNLTINKGEVTVLLGRNGAGKTTTLKSILGFVNYSGEIKIFNSNINDVRGKISYIPEDKSLYENLNIKNMLKLYESIFEGFSVDKAINLVKRFNLPMNKKIKSFSNGMKTSLYIVLSLSQRADLFIFDEPTSSLDPIIRENVLEMIRQLVIDEKSVLYTTHIIPEAEIIADKICIIEEGELLFSDYLDSIKENYILITVPKKKNKKYTFEDVFCMQELSNAFNLIVDKKESKKYISEETVIENLDLNTFFQTLIRGRKNDTNKRF